MGFKASPLIEGCAIFLSWNDPREHWGMALGEMPCSSVPWSWSISTPFPMAAFYVKKYFKTSSYRTSASHIVWSSVITTIRTFSRLRGRGWSHVPGKRIFCLECLGNARLLQQIHNTDGRGMQNEWENKCTGQLVEEAKPSQLLGSFNSKFSSVFIPLSRCFSVRRLSRKKNLFRF